MARTFPTIQFERYVDDAVVHCVSKAQAEMVARAIGDRMIEVGLRLHPDKTVYCKDANRRGEHEHTAFTFLGYTFRARGVRSRTGTVFTGFTPAISKEALKRISTTIRRWRLDRRTSQTLTDFKRVRSFKKAKEGWQRIIDQHPRTFAHWAWVTTF